MNRHHLKTHPPAFHAVRNGLKRFEYRRNDRGFEEGDVLVLEEWSPDAQGHTGKSEEVRVTYMLTGPDYGIPAGFAVMSIKRLHDERLEAAARVSRTGWGS